MAFVIQLTPTRSLRSFEATIIQWAMGSSCFYLFQRFEQQIILNFMIIIHTNTHTNTIAPICLAYFQTKKKQLFRFVFTQCVNQLVLNALCLVSQLPTFQVFSILDGRGCNNPLPFFIKATISCFFIVFSL